MNTRSRDRGTALILATIITIIVIGIGGAFLAETIWRGKAQGTNVESAQAQIICDAAFDKARRALWVYRNDFDSDGPHAWAWNDILTYSNNLSCWTSVNLVIDGESVTSKEVNTDYVKQDYLQTLRNIQMYSNSPSDGGSATSFSGQTDFSTYMQYINTPGVNTMAAYEAPLPTNRTSPTYGDDTTNQVFIGWNRPYLGGAFHVAVRDNDDGDNDLLVDADRKLICTVTATLPDGTQQQIEGLVEYVESDYNPEGALLSDGTILMNGSPTIRGTRGKVHANEDVYIGDPRVTVEDSIDAVRIVMNNTGNPIDETYFNNPPADGVNPNADNVDLPDAAAADYRNYADYILDATSGARRIYAVGDPAMNLYGTPAFSDVTFNAAQGWKVSGNTGTPAGTYYVVGDGDLSHKVADITLTGSGSITHRVMTVISEGSVFLTGNANITSNETNTLVIADGDIQIQGNAGSVVEGVMYAGEQVNIMGNGTVNGSVTGKNKQDLSTTVSTGSRLGDEADVGGSAIINWNGGASIIKNTKDHLLIRNLRKLK